MFASRNSIFFVLLCSLALQASAILTRMEYEGGSYSYEDFDQTKTGPQSDSQMRAVVMARWAELEHIFQNDGTHRPAIMASLFIPGHGILHGSSIKGNLGDGNQNGAVDDELIECHKVQGNCAEIHVFFQARRRNISLPRIPGCKLAVYGLLPSGRTGYMSPCKKDAADPQGKLGCHEFVPSTVEVVT